MRQHYQNQKSNERRHIASIDASRNKSIRMTYGVLSVGPLSDPMVIVILDRVVYAQYVI